MILHQGIYIILAFYEDAQKLNAEHYENMAGMSELGKSSVTDPDPVGSSLFVSPRSGSGKIPNPDPLFTKRPPVIQLLSLNKIV